jgi:hypothetical protein
MLEGPVDRRWAGGVVGDQHHRTELQVLDDGVEVAGLVGGGVGVAGGLVGGSPAEEVEDHQPAAGEPGQQPVVEVQVVGEPVQQDDRRFLARILAGVDVVPAARDVVLPVGGPAGRGRLHGV